MCMVLEWGSLGAVKNKKYFATFIKGYEDSKQRKVQESHITLENGSCFTSGEGTGRDKVKSG